MPLFEGILHFEYGERVMTSYDCFCFVPHPKDDNTETMLFVDASNAFNQLN